jgi:hypothetical protein
MFVRLKHSGRHHYLQIVHNQRRDGRVRQRVIATLGRLDVLQRSGQIDALLASCARFAEHTAVLDAQRRGQMQPAQTVRIGPDLVFGRLWHDLGLPALLAPLLANRRFEFDVERAVFLTVLHRLFASGSDRAAERWRHAYRIDGTETLELHHLYRAMAWLGEELPDQRAATPFGPRCTKDLIEEAWFGRRRDLFSQLDLVFFDTTSIYFEGHGGETLGRYGHSKDHRPDRKQLVLGVLLDGAGRPICCELWPGNVADAKTLIPIVDRLQQRFAIGSVCIVADRGMISKQTIGQLQAPERQVRFLLGARLRAVKEIRTQVLAHRGRYTVVYGPKQNSKDRAPLKVKEVRLGDRRYIVCHNEDQALKDRADRAAILAALRDKLQRGAKPLVGNKGYRKYLHERPGGGFVIDEDKVRREARFDGKWVLQTDTDLSPAEAALKFKDLLLVEQFFRSIKSVLRNRPIYHKCDETIRGHVFCSFLALALLKELQARMHTRGWVAEWNRLRDDLNALEEITVTTAGKAFVIRSDLHGDAGRAIQAVGIALGPVVRLVEPAERLPLADAASERSATGDGA